MVFEEFAVTWCVQEYFNGRIHPSTLTEILDTFTDIVADTLLLTKFNVDSGAFDLSIMDVQRQVNDRYRVYWEVMNDATNAGSDKMMKLGMAFASFLPGNERDPLIFMPAVALFRSLLPSMKELFRSVEIV